MQKMNNKILQFILNTSKNLRRKITIKKIKTSNIKIMSIDETLNYLENGYSIARFGDGELNIIMGGRIGFQDYNPSLVAELENVLSSNLDNCLIAIPDAISTLNNLTEQSREFWINNMMECRSRWLTYLKTNREYGNAHVSRCYIRYADKSKCGAWFDRIKRLFDDRNIVIVEGEKTKLGCGNDLLANARSVGRIICPAENAFDRIEQIFAFINERIDKSSMIVLALGPTATVLAYELAKENYQALDLGHLDIEYEWYKKGLSHKEAIAGKYTNEVIDGNQADESLADKKYLNEILVRIH